MGYITQAVVINFAPLLFVMFNREFNISYSAIGALLSVNFAVQITVDLLSVFFVDKLGYRRSAVISQFLCAAGFLLFPFLTYSLPSAYAGIFISTVIYSVGAGIIEIVINPIVASTPRESESSSGALIFLHSFYCWGQLLVVLLTSVAIFLFSDASWGYISVFWGMLPLINGFLFTKTPIVPLPPEEKRERIGGLCTDPTFIILLAMMICAGGSEIAMSQWASTFAQTALGVDKIIGDLLGPCLFALFMGIGRTIHGVFGARLNITRHLYINAVLCIVCYLVAALSRNSYFALAGCAVCGYAISIMWPSIVEIAAQKFPDGSGAMYGAVAIFGDVGCSAGAFFTGLIASMSVWGEYGFKVGLGTNIIYPIAFIVLLTVLQRKMHRPL
ncbi:MAG: MFS transporter [Clostridia bacterium]|nr:MFS transporter [Clostridia bacterium]